MPSHRAPSAPSRNNKASQVAPAHHEWRSTRSTRVRAYWLANHSAAKREIRVAGHTRPVWSDSSRSPGAGAGSKLRAPWVGKVGRSLVASFRSIERVPTSHQQSGRKNARRRSLHSTLNACTRPSAARAASLESVPEGSPVCSRAGAVVSDKQRVVREAVQPDGWPAGEGFACCVCRRRPIFGRP